ncbi:MAG: hypothetical protein ACPG31_01460 [Planctomycetota bacterium]
MPLRTSNQGRTALWVPGLLLMLAVAVVWVWNSGTGSNEPDPTDTSGFGEPGPSDIDVSRGELEVDQTVKDRQEAENLPELPRFGVVQGRVTAAKWVTWPSGIELKLSDQEDGKQIALAGPSEEEPRFRFEGVPYGNYRLTIAAPECVEQSLLLTVSAEQRDQFLAIPLVPAASIVGTVKDEFGKPVAQIPVAALFHSDAPGRSQVPYLATTDEEGKYRITGLRDGEWQVFVGSVHHPLSEMKVLGISREAPEAWADFIVPRMGSAKVQVDFLDGADAAKEDWKSMKIQAVLQGGERGYNQSLPLRADGSVRFPALPNGEYHFIAFGGSYRRVMRAASVAPDVLAEVTIPMRRYSERKQ